MDKVTFIIPTLNAEKSLPSCLKSIRNQSYPQDKIEIIIADGGSIDTTLDIAKLFKCKLVHNPLQTAESGKAIGLKHSKGKYIAFVDSDNILPVKFWLKKMLLPFKNPEVQVSEPWSFTYRKKAGFIERYSSLFGVNDPFVFVSGLYDRLNVISGKWTNLLLSQQEYSDYYIIQLFKNNLIPTIGANGTIFRSTFLCSINIDKYLFDIDIIQLYLDVYKSIYISKVKIGIIHTYCESSIYKFIRKQSRRITDYFIYKDKRNFNWRKSNLTSIPKYIFYTLLVIPPFLDSFRGFFKKPDIAWFFHPLACLLTLYLYAIISIKNYFHILKPIQRNIWQQ